MAAPYSQRVHVLRVLDSTGDTEISYDPADAEAVSDVEERFRRLMDNNFVAFDVSTHPGKIITTFDPNAREVIVSHRFAGG